MFPIENVLVPMYVDWEPTAGHNSQPLSQWWQWLTTSKIKKQRPLYSNWRTTIFDFPKFINPWKWLSFWKKRTRIYTIWIKEKKLAYIFSFHPYIYITVMDAWADHSGPENLETSSQIKISWNQINQFHKNLSWP